MNNITFEEVKDILKRSIDETANMNDAIERTLQNTYLKGWNDAERKKEQEKLPPVTSQPKTGHWYIDERPESDRKVICSNCEQPIFKYHKMDFDYRPKYCPNCGARMVEPQESNDKCKNCEYYRNPDYTRCHECKAESEE